MAHLNTTWRALTPTQHRAAPRSTAQHRAATTRLLSHPSGSTSISTALRGRSLHVNNNGNVSLDGALSACSTAPFSTLTTRLLAPFFADVDTRGVGSDVVRYGTDTLDGRKVFGVNWINVGDYAYGTDQLNSFQLAMTDRSDIRDGDFDFTFNCDRIEWTSGQVTAAADKAGLGYTGGNSASAFELAYSDATDPAHYPWIHPHSAVIQALNSAVQGRYNFQVRHGAVATYAADPELVNSVPEPASLLRAGWST